MKLFKDTSVGTAIVTNGTIRKTLQPQKLITDKFNLSDICELYYQEDLKECLGLPGCTSQYASSYTHTHTHTYIYIYIYNII